MSEHGAWTARLEPSGATFDAPAGRTLLQSARAAGIELPSACRNGTCRRCICRLVAGSVVYRIDWPGLSREERAEGFILPCVAHPASALVIDAPAGVVIGAPDSVVRAQLP